MIRRPPRSTHCISSAASDVYKRQNAEWFKNKKVLEKEITCLVFKVDGETNTDDLSPAVHATTRPDIPMHALAMLEFKKPDGLKILNDLKKQNLQIAYVGDVVGLSLIHI